MKYHVPKSFRDMLIKTRYWDAVSDTWETKRSLQSLGSKWASWERPLENTRPVMELERTKSIRSVSCHLVGGLRALTRWCLGAGTVLSSHTWGMAWIQQELVQGTLTPQWPWGTSLLSPYNCFKNCERPHLGSHSHLFRTSSREDRRRDVGQTSGFCGELAGAPSSCPGIGSARRFCFTGGGRTLASARHKAGQPPGCCFHLPVAQLSWERTEGARESHL